MLELRPDVVTRDLRLGASPIRLRSFGPLFRPANPTSMLSMLSSLSARHIVSMRRRPRGGYFGSFERLSVNVRLKFDEHVEPYRLIE